MVIIFVLVGIVALAVIALLLTAIFANRKYFRRRYDGNPNLKYFTADDFHQLEAEPISFPSDKGQVLRGYIYRSSQVPAEGLIIFSHGYGAGHLSYTTEINTLAQSGFAVLAYDATGCVASDGKYFGGFDQGPIDLRFAIKFAKEHPVLKSFGGCVLTGHSWGGFTVMNSVNDPWVRGAVAMCGFIDGASVMAQTAAGQTKKGAAHRWWRIFVPGLALLNWIKYGKEGNKNSIKSLLNTDKPVLLLYGEKDKTVFYPNNGERIRRAVIHKNNITFLSYNKKGHNVYLTEQAEGAMYEIFGAIAKTFAKDKERAIRMYSQIDYDKITQEDPAVMNRIVDFCKSSLGLCNSSERR